MGTIIPFAHPARPVPPTPKVGRRHARVLFFERQEFSSLLALYSTQVARGIWRDYAVDFLPGQALFSVFRHAHEAPVLTVAKRLRPGGKGQEYVLYASPRRLARADDLAGLRRAINAAAGRF